MNRDATARVAEDGAEALVVGDEKIAGRRTHENLDAGRARQPLELGDVGRVLVGAADEEGEIAVHAAGGAAHLVGQRLGGHRQRVGVRHLEDGGDAAHDGRARTALQVFLVLGAGFAEMDLRVDDAGQDGEAGAIDDLAPGTGVNRADGGDAAVADADIAESYAILIDDGAVPENEVEGRWHRSSPLLRRPPPLT